MKLFSKACGVVLSLPEQQVTHLVLDHMIHYDIITQALSGQFKNDPKLVYQVGLTPQKVS